MTTKLLGMLLTLVTCASLPAAELAPEKPMTAKPAAPKRDSLVVSVVGQVSPEYRRTPLKNGKFKAERYVIADGGKYEGTTRSASFDKVKYPEVAGVVARHLAANQYYLAQKAKDATLLIAIHWGETLPFNSTNYALAVDQLGAVMRNMQAMSFAGRMNERTGEISTGSGNMAGVGVSELEFAMARIEMENGMRDAANEKNAQILGYLDSINDRREMIPWADVGGIEQEMVSDVEEERYYVVITAYDFKALRDDGKKMPLWATRISIATRGSGFDERVAQMVAAGASTFGQKQGLQRRYHANPSVTLGETQFHGVATPAPESRK